MHASRKILVFLILLLAGAVSVAESADFTSQPPHALVVDTTQDGNFPVRDYTLQRELTIVFTNLNPFAYSYTFKIDQDSAETGALGSFVGALGLPDKAKAEGDQDGSTTPDTSAGGDKTLLWVDVIEEDCVKASDQAAQFLAQAERVRQFAGAAIEQNRRLNAHYSLAKDHVAALTGEGSRDRHADAIREDARSASKALEGVKEAAKQIRSFEQQAVGAVEALVKLETDPACPAVETRRTGLLKDTQKYLGDISAIVTAYLEVEAAVNAQFARLTRTLDDPNSFKREFHFGPYWGAYDFDISFTRKLLSSKDNLATIDVAKDLRLGQRRFHVSSGIGYGFADRRSFGRESGVLEDGTTGTFVAETDRRDVGVGFVTQLNARVGTLPWGSDTFWGATLGVSVTNGEDDVDFGPYVGLFAAATEKVFVTLGYAKFDVQSLSGGFSVGDVVPGDFEGDIPVRTRSEGGLLLSVTFAID